MLNKEPLEGGPPAKLAQIIKQLGHNDFDRFEIATVTAAPPALSLRINGMKFDLDASDLVVAEHLTTRKVTVSSDGGNVWTEMHVKSPLEVGDRVIVASMNNGQAYVVLDRAITL